MQVSFKVFKARDYKGKKDFKDAIFLKFAKSTVNRQTNLNASSSLVPSFAAFASRRSFTPTIKSLFWFMHLLHNSEST